MEYLYKQIKVNSKKYGKVNTWLSRRAKYGDGYFTVTNKGNKVLSGLVDEFGNEIIPLDNMELTGLLIANKGNDVCFEFMHPNNEIPEYYHIKIDEDNKSKLVFKTDYNSEIPLFICSLDNTEDYWAIQMGIEDKKYAVYDYKENKMITTFLDEVRYQEDSPNHYFYYGIAIETEITQPDGTKTPHIHSSLCGFLDGKGNLSSQIYDIESNQLYSSYQYGPDTLSPKFNELVLNITKGYEQLYYEKEYHTDEVLNYMYQNPNMSEKPKDYKEGNRVLDFKPRKKV